MITIRIAVIAVLATSGCIRVQAHQRARLAKPNMQMGGDPQTSEIEQHVYETREGAAGGAGGTGGGCGCN